MAVAIVLAGGSGKRMNTDVAKQFLKINGKEVLYYSLRAFENNGNITDIVLVTREEDIEYCKKNIIDEYGFSKVSNIVCGGKERYDSVYNGLQVISTYPECKRQIVLIHDGARPFITDIMINESVKKIQSGCQACTIAVPAKDTIKKVENVDGKILGIETPDRKFLYQIQTPQTFEFNLIMSSYGKMLKDHNHNITDDTMLVEQYSGVYSEIIEGAYENIKITTSEDLEIGEIFAKKSF